MTDRKAIPRKIRFEIFKRDSFACQYCGVAAPDALLVIDHIKPIAEGGSNDITNLLTACQACNAGKGARELDDDSVVARQKRQLDDLNERRNQLELMMEWREGLLSIEGDKLKIIVTAIGSKSQFVPNDAGKREIQKWLKKYELVEILNAIDTSYLQYLELEGNEANSESWNRAFSAVPGIIRVTRSSREKPYLRDMLYVRGILRNRLNYVNEKMVLGLIEDAIVADADIESLKRLATRVSSWTQFTTAIHDYLESRDPEA